LSVGVFVILNIIRVCKRFVIFFIGRFLIWEFAGCITPAAMPSPNRTNTQKLVTLHVDGVLFDAAEKARGRVNRSQWIRDAIAEKCAREGIPVPEDAVYAPDRGRKAGQAWSPEIQRKMEATPILNDAPNPSPPAKQAMKKVTYPKGKRPKKTK
jgi:hypothetical protein